MQGLHRILGGVLSTVRYSELCRDLSLQLFIGSSKEATEV
jgi:hypothetical protein